MKKLFVVADVHSFFTIMHKELKKNGFDIDNPDHIFVSCGDMFDRGPETRECLDFVDSLPKERKLLIRGNHEDLLSNILNKNIVYAYDLSNGTVRTMEHISGLSGNNKLIPLMIQYTRNDKKLKQYYLDMVDGAIVGDYTFVHGWIPEDWSSHESWDDSRWKNGMKEWSNGNIVEGKTIVCGHWHTSWGHAYLHNDGCEFIPKWATSEDEFFVNDKPFIDKGIIALDACTARSKKINCLTIEISDKEWEERKLFDA